MLQANTVTNQQNATRTVMLIHGWGAHKIMMALLAHRLQQLGYHTVNWGYWSLGRTIEHHGEAVHRKLQELDRNAECEELFLVTHSMGGIVARSALTHGQPSKLHRMVMLAPPNHGSPWAKWLGPVIQPICHTLHELSTTPDSFVNRLPEPSTLELGIISAGLDLLVPRDSTKLVCARDYFEEPLAWHSGVLFRNRVVRQIDHFLRNGHFASR